MDKKTAIFVVLIFALSVIYRYGLATVGPNYIQADSAVYQQMAVDIFGGKWVSDGGNRTYYYPVFVSAVFRIFGFDSILGLRFAQSLIDSLSGLAVFFIVLKLTGKKFSAFAAYIIYAINPVTSTYAGLYLTEILSAFSTVLVLLATLSKKIKWFWWGLTLAFWGTVRLAFFPVAIILVPVGLYLIYRRKQLKTGHVVLAIGGFLLAMVYPLLSNYQLNHKFSLYPNGDISKFYLYEGLQAHFMPETWNGLNGPVMPANVIWSWNFYNLPPAEYHRKANEILIRYENDVLANPVDFLKWRVIHAVKVWNKSHLYYYLDPAAPGSHIWLPVGNLAVLSLSVIGWIGFGKKIFQSHYFLFINVIVMMALSTLLLALKPPEERLTVPLYPIVFMFAGMGIEYIGQRLKPVKILTEKNI